MTRTSLAGVSGHWETEEDTKGRAYVVRNPLNQAFTTEHYPDGQPWKQWLPNNTRQEHVYNSRGLLYEIAHIRGASTLFDRFRYAYDPDGRVLTETDLGGRIHGFNYDPLGQLASETHPDLPTGIQYHYDAHGNRTSVAEDGATEWYFHDPADKLLWTNTNGNTEPNGGQNKKYTRFEYDGFGQISKRAGGPPTAARGRCCTSTGTPRAACARSKRGRTRSSTPSTQRTATASRRRTTRRVATSTASGSTTRVTEGRCTRPASASGGDHGPVLPQ